MDTKMESIVKVDVTKASTLATQTSINTVALIGKSKSGAVAGTVTDLETGLETYGKDEEMGKLLKSFFGESNPGEVYCQPIESVTGETIVAAIEAVIEKKDVYHFVVRADADTSASEIKSIQEKAAELFKFVHVEFSDIANVKTVMGNATITANPPTRVAVYYHSEESGKSLAAALVANRCAVDPARGTWAHKTLDGIEPDNIGKSDFDALAAGASALGVNVYTTIAGVNRTFLGTSCSNDQFIDTQIKKDWLKFRVAEEIFNLLGNANDGYGVEFDDAGIQSVCGAVNKIFGIANDAKHRYIMDNSWDVEAPKYADIDTQKKKNRTLSGVVAHCDIMNSIHKVDRVTIMVNDF
mgnify:CR=1 FL=1